MRAWADKSLQGSAYEDITSMSRGGDVIGSDQTDLAVLDSNGRDDIVWVADTAERRDVAVVFNEARKTLRADASEPG